MCKKQQRNYTDSPLTRMEAGLMTWIALASDADMAVSWFLICSEGIFWRKGPTGESSLVE